MDGRILLVEDSEPVRVALSEQLRGKGYRVTAAASSSEAIVTFMQDPSLFDLVLIDHVLPDLEGEFAAEKMLQARADIPVIMMTGFAGSLRQDVLERIRPARILNKPFTRKELLEAVRQTLS